MLMVLRWYALFRRVVSVPRSGSQDLGEVCTSLPVLNKHNWQPPGTGWSGPGLTLLHILCLFFFTTYSSHMVQNSATRQQSPACGPQMAGRPLSVVVRTPWQLPSQAELLLCRSPVSVNLVPLAELQTEYYNLAVQETLLNARTLYAIRCKMFFKWCSSCL